MSKEYWLMCYESAIQDIDDEKDTDYDDAEKILEMKLENDPYYLDGYLSYE